MLTRIKWDIANIAKLTEMWNAEKSDLEIAEVFNTGVYGIAKERTRLGLITRKMPEHTNRAPKSDTHKSSNILNALYYTKDGLNHFSIIDSTKDPVQVARKIMYSQDVKEIVILQPIVKLKQGTMDVI